MNKDMQQTRNLAELFVRIFNHIKINSYNHLNEETELTPTQLTALKYLSQHKRNLLSDLAAGLNISNAAVTKMTDRLEKKGLVKRVDFAEDRRAISLQLTELGKNIIEKAEQQEIKSWQKVIERMDEQRRNALIQGIIGFIQAGLVDIKDYNEICLKCGIKHNEHCLLEKAKNKNDTICRLKQ